MLNYSPPSDRPRSLLRPRRSPLPLLLAVLAAGLTVAMAVVR